MNNTDENDYYRSLHESQQDEYETLGEDYEDNILIEDFDSLQDEYEALGEQQENDIQALIDQYESQLFSADPTFIPTYEKASDDWFIIDEDYSLEQSDDAPSNINLRFTIHKKLNRKSNSGKTPYFSYHILDNVEKKTNLKIGSYSCMDSATEHWVSWKFSNDSIERTDYIRDKQLNEPDFHDSKQLMFPIEYSFAELIQLHEYNPFNFNFNRLNFLTQESKTVCGDKFAKIKIIGSNNQFLVLSIFNFENNIIGLLKQLNESTSFNEFHLKSHLTLAVKYLSHMLKSDFSKSDFPMFNSYLSIIAQTGIVIDQNYKFINKDIKDNKESDINTLLSSYYNLKNELDSFI